MRKIKIGIITIHTDFNYGAVLQAIATQKFLEMSGYDAEIINYENEIISKQSKISYKQDNKFIGYFVTFIRNTIFGRYFYFKKAVKDIDKYRIISKTKYVTKEQISDSSYDLLVVGSDQLWNPNISRGLDSVFMLNFDTRKKKMSISTSMGSYNLTESEREIFRKTLKDFDFISVREKHAKDQLSNLTDKEIKVILDPTLLLDKYNWWNDLASKSKYFIKNEKYILTYFVGGNKNKYRNTVKEYAEKLKLPVWTLQYSNYTWKESNKKILGASVADFIALIGNADLVITDSFHGVAFSVNLGVDFVALTNTGNPVRVKELLEKLNLLDRIDLSANAYKKIIYENSIEKLNVLRKDSTDWIINSINSIDFF